MSPSMSVPDLIPVSVKPTAARTAEPSRFDLALQGATQGAAASLAASVALAAPYVPGGPVLAGAVRGAAVGAVAAAAAPAPAAGGGDILEATRAIQAQAQSFNVQYLLLQEALQRESREFTALSNVMKVKHDAAKDAIGNIR